IDNQNFVNCKLFYKALTTHFQARKHKANVLLLQIKTIKKILIMKKVFVKGFALAAVVALSFTNISCETKTNEEQVEDAAADATEAADAAAEAADAAAATDAAVEGATDAAADATEAAADATQEAADATKAAAEDVKDAAQEAAQ